MENHDPAVPITTRPLARIHRDVAQVDPHVRDAIRAALRGRRWPLFLYGPAGTGKTCVGLLLCDQYGGRYFTIEHLADRAFHPDDCEPWRSMGTAPLIVLDELGCRNRDSDREYGAVKRAADLRGNRPLVWISNLAPGELVTTFDDRIASRVCCGARIAFTGADRRFEQSTRRGPRTAAALETSKGAA